MVSMLPFTIVSLKAQMPHNQSNIEKEHFLISLYKECSFLYLIIVKLNKLSKKVKL